MADALRKLGFDLSREELDKAFTRFKELADRKPRITDVDLEALVAGEVLADDAAWRFVGLQVAGGTVMSPTATVRLSHDAGVVEQSAIGDGMVDAACAAIAKAVGVDARLLEFHVSAVSGGTDALGDVTVQVEHEGVRVTGRGVATDVVEASARAYLQAVNKLARSTERKWKCRHDQATQPGPSRGGARRHGPGLRRGRGGRRGAVVVHGARAAGRGGRGPRRPRPRLRHGGLVERTWIPGRRPGRRRDRAGGRGRGAQGRRGGRGTLRLRPGLGRLRPRGRPLAATGEALPDAVLEELREVDAILLGAVGRPDVPPGVLERGLLLRLRFELDLYVNLRPVKLYPGMASPLADVKPDDIDLLVVRENTEGVYVGAGGTVHRGGPAEAATETSIETRAGVERCLRFAAAKARERAGRLTLVHKTNVLVHAGDLWQRAARAVAEETGVALDYAHADAACLYLVSDPGRFDVIVTDNLFGDILTDLGAAIAGGLGTAASANLNPGSSPSLFEPVHGSAPDIAGTGRANPVAAVLSASLLLDHLGEREAAAAVEAGAVAALPGAAGYSTQALGDRIATAVAGGGSPD